MPKYNCPIVTCNVSFEGSISDIIIPAVMHSEGSHQAIISDNDVIKTIEEQARKQNLSPTESPAQDSIDKAKEIFTGDWAETESAMPIEQQFMEENGIDPDWWKRV